MAKDKYNKPIVLIPQSYINDLGDMQEGALKLYHLAYLAAKAAAGQNYFSMTADQKVVVDMLERIGFLSVNRPGPGITGKPALPQLFEGHTVLLPR